MLASVAGCCFIDDFGRLHEALAAGDAARLADDGSFLEHAVRQRGFVALEERQDSLCVSLAPATVSPVALSAACYHLADREARRIAIAWLDGAWNRRVFESRDDAIRQLVRFFPQRRERDGDFLSRARPIEGLEGYSPLAMLARLARGGRPPLGALQELLRHGLKGCYVLVQAADDGNVYFREIGWGFPWLEQQWRLRARGLRIQDQPDYHLGSWVADAYRDVAASGRMRADDIDAITVTPQLGRRRIRYTRLILPVETPWGARCLLGACLLNARIDLRPGAGAAEDLG